MSYKATDDDLPASLWPGTEVKVSKPRPTAEELAKEVQLHWEHPGIDDERAEPLARRNFSRKSILADIDENSGKKHYVKRGKILAMRTWAFELRDGAIDCRFRLTEWEADFVNKFLFKILTYGVMRVKWVTRRQYEAMRFLGVKYLTRKDTECQQKSQNHLQPPAPFRDAAKQSK